MEFDLILETMQRLPSASFMLVLFMSISAAVLVNHIVRAGFYTTMASIPMLLIAGLFGNAVLILNNVILSPDRASNTALSASFGFILFATMAFLIMRIWARLRDKS